MCVCVWCVVGPDRSGEACSSSVPLRCALLPIPPAACRAPHTHPPSALPRPAHPPPKRPQGCTAEPRTYNTIISACSKGGQPGAALRVYERMLADGVQPTGTTYTSLISAFGKAGQVEEALRVYQVRCRPFRGRGGGLLQGGARRQQVHLLTVLPDQ